MEGIKIPAPALKHLAPVTPALAPVQGRLKVSVSTVGEALHDLRGVVDGGSAIGQTGAYTRETLEPLARQWRLLKRRTPTGLYWLLQQMAPAFDALTVDVASVRLARSAELDHGVVAAHGASISLIAIPPL